MLSLKEILKVIFQVKGKLSQMQRRPKRNKTKTKNKIKKKTPKWKV